MLKNYSRTVLVNLKKHKIYSFLNISGLAVGIAAAILISAYIFHELSFDRFHEKADNIFRLKSSLIISGEQLNIPKSSPPMGPYFCDNFPEVVNFTRLSPMGRIPVQNSGIIHNEDHVFYADNSFFDLFTFPLIKGDPENVLVTPGSAVITERIARKYFANEDPMGKLLRVNDKTDFTVTGIAAQLPANSHFTFDMLCSFENFAAENKREMSNWLSLNHYTYILLRAGTDFSKLEDKVPQIIEKRAGAMLKFAKAELDLSLQLLTDIHLRSNLTQEISATSNIAYIYIFSAVALLILAIACINFMNLSTARSAYRAREVGLRKVLGADRGRIIRQFLGESVFFSFLALLAALFLVELSLPLFKSVSGIALEFNYAANPWILPGLIGLALLVGLISGSYPAVFLSAVQPARIVKGAFKTGTTGSRFRSVLVIAQFTISVTLIIGTIIVYKQLNFMKSSRLGFNKEQIVTIPISDESTLGSLKPIRQELLNLGGVVSVAASSQVPGQPVFINPYIPEGFSREEMQYMGELYVDHDFISTLGIELAAGRNFNPDLKTDIRNSVIINETAARKFGWDKPLGKTISDLSMSLRLEKRTVVGVVKDFNLESLHKKIPPLIIACTTHRFNSLSVRISPVNISSTISAIRNRFNQFNPNLPFEFAFLDDSFDAEYRGEERLSKIFSYFSVIAIVIACLGLFGLASFTTEQRTKEVGIRKVFGASVSGIIILLSKEFSKWVLAANIVAWPIAFLALNRWLEGFPYHTQITPVAFLLASVISLLIALLTVSFQAVRAATANPVDSLHNE